MLQVPGLQTVPQLLIEHFHALNVESFLFGIYSLFSDEFCIDIVIRLDNFRKKNSWTKSNKILYFLN